MISDSQLLKQDLSKGNQEDNLSFTKQVEVDLTNESVEDRNNGNHTKHYISWIFTLSEFTWMPNQESCIRLNHVYCYDQWQTDDLLHNLHSV